MIKLVITDIDGTIVGKDEILHDEFIEAVKTLRQRGLEFTVATGRVAEFVTGYVEKLGITIPYAVGNGGTILQKEKILLRKTIPLKPLRVVIEKADEMGMSLLYGIDGKDFAYRLTEYVSDQQQKFGRYENPRLLQEYDWDTIRIDKLIVMAKVRDGSIDVIEDLCKQLPEEFYYKRYANKALDILHRDAKKEIAVVELARLCGLSMDQVLIAGDDLNDIEMIRCAGIGVAVANAQEVVKEA